MMRFRINKAGLFVLVTALLAMQWASAHIHLSEDHNHDGSHHEHALVTHAHAAIDHHDNAIDSANHTGGDNIVELEPECRTSLLKLLEEQPFTSVLSTFPPPALYSAPAIRSTDIGNTKLSYLTQSSVHPRAPPQHF